MAPTIQNTRGSIADGHAPLKGWAHAPNSYGTMGSGSNTDAIWCWPIPVEAAWRELLTLTQTHLLTFGDQNCHDILERHTEQ